MKEPKDSEPAAGSLTSEYDLNVEPHPPSAADGSVRVLLPDEPPPLTPEAARALFRLLLNVHRQRRGELDD
jgi:hypothetical protein